MKLNTLNFGNLLAASALALSLNLHALAQPGAVPTNASGLQLVAPESVPAVGGAFFYLSKPGYPASPALSVAARAAGCPIYRLPWDRPAYLVDDTAIAEQAQYRLGSSANSFHPPTPGGSGGGNGGGGGSSTNSPPAFVPPTGYAPCDTYREFGSSVSNDAGWIQLTLSNTLPGLERLILRADDLSDLSWATNQTITAAGFTAAASPISAGTNAPGFFRAELAADYSAPVITSPPEDAVVPQDAPVTFSVVATGSPTPTYQWQFNGTDIPGATVSAWPVSSAQPTNVGTYTVIVSNVICTASASAALGLAWTNYLGDAITASPAVGSDGTIYIATMSRFYALNPVLGAVKWSTNIANGDWNSLAPSASVAPDNSAVYIASQAGSVLAFNPTNGVLVWSNYLGGMIYGSPAVSAADGTVCIGNALRSPEGNT